MIAAAPFLSLSRDPFAAAIEAGRSRRQGLVYCLPHALVHPRNALMTYERLGKAIDKGLGQGRDDYYCPWLRIRRGLASPVSNLVVQANPLYDLRPFHLLSRHEACGARIACWLGAREVREQFPAWPDPHGHPNGGRAGSRMLEDVAGLREIARSLGIDHGVYPGTTIPYVATIDLVLELDLDDGRSVLVFWAVKPQGLLQGPRSARVQERLALQRAYVRSVGGHFEVFSVEPLPEFLDGQLEWFAPTHLVRSAVAGTSFLADFVGHFLDVVDRPLEDACRYAGERIGVASHLDRHSLFRCAAWLGAIPLDFTRKIYMSRPALLDRGFKDELRRRLFGQV